MRQHLIRSTTLSPNRERMQCNSLCMEPCTKASHSGLGHQAIHYIEQTGSLHSDDCTLKSGPRASRLSVRRLRGICAVSPSSSQTCTVASRHSILPSSGGLHPKNMEEPGGSSIHLTWFSPQQILPLLSHFNGHVLSEYGF